MGHYLPALQPKKIELKKERIEYWLSKGAQPSDTAASLFKNNGIEGMEKFMEPRDKQKKKKKAPQEAPQKPAAESEPAAQGGEAPVTEAPAADAAPAAEEPKAEDPKAEEAPKEEPSKEEPPAA